MKTFIYRLLSISSVLFVIIIALELIAFAFPNEYSFKRKYVEKSGDKIKVLVLGHSHTAHGIDPMAIGDSVFNMAISGRVHYYDAQLAERYIPTLKNLKCVIWPIGYNFGYLSYLYDVTENKISNDFMSTYQCMYEKYMNISYEKHIPYFHLSELTVNSHEFTKKIFSKNKASMMDCDSVGYKKLSKKDRKADWKQEIHIFQIDYSHPDTPKARQEGIDNFKRIAAACRNANVRLVVISTPCYRTYRERMTERGKRKMMECVDSMRSVYPAMEYYNFIADSRFTDDDFFDASHVCDQGAEKLSKILKDTLNL